MRANFQLCSRIATAAAAIALLGLGGCATHFKQVDPNLNWSGNDGGRAEAQEQYSNTVAETPQDAEKRKAGVYR
jgi:hypothetical protein